MKRLFYLIILLLLTSCTALYDVDELLIVKESAEETLIYLEDLNKKFPTDEEIAYQYAYALTSLGDSERAIVVLEEWKDSSSALLLLLHIYKEEEMESEYLEVLNNLILLDDKNIKAKEDLLTYYEEHDIDGEKLAKEILTYEVKNEKALAYLAKTNDFYSLFISPATIESQSSLNSTPE